MRSSTTSSGNSFPHSSSSGSSRSSSRGSGSSTGSSTGCSVRRADGGSPQQDDFLDLSVRVCNDGSLLIGFGIHTGDKSIDDLALEVGGEVSDP
jgi:hypothetical protein